MSTVTDPVNAPKLFALGGVAAAAFAVAAGVSARSGQPGLFAPALDEGDGIGIRDRDFDDNVKRQAREWRRRPISL